MKVFLWEEKQFFSVNRKEELDDNTFIISDFEQSQIKESLENEGHLWIEDNEIKWSGPIPDDVYDWDNDTKEWVKNQERYATKLAEKQEHVWEGIKAERLKQTTSGVYVPSVDKVFHTDDVSVIQYNNIGNMIALDNFEPIQWKVKDNTWITLTEEVFKDLQKAMVQNTNRIYQVAEEHKANMMEIDNPEDYDYSTGWNDADALNKET